MDHGQLFVLAIIGMSLFAGVLRMGIMAKHGYPLNDRRARRAMRRRHRPFGLTLGAMAVHDDNDDDDYGPAAQRKIDGLMLGDRAASLAEVGELLDAA